MRKQLWELMLRMQNFIDIIKERGFIHQMTDEAGLRELVKTPGQTAYIGFDCTAPSLHVGSLVQIMLLRWWQKCGHRPIVLLGGGTTKIGDPSGKDESRPPLTDAQIQTNMDGLKVVFSQFLDFSSNEAPTNAARMVNNDDWLRGLNYIEFLSNYGRHFSINRMLTMDSVKLRLEREQNLSFLEFNYMILQAYDFVELNKREGCRVQMGGSDQWGNIVSGIELARRLGRGELFGITSPLITTASGAKMGKTAAGAVWLNAELCSPYDYWQFWRNTEDGDVIRFLKLFTEIDLAQIAEYENWVGSARINDAKKILATEATALLHGREAAEKAARTAAETFSGTGVSANLPEYHTSFDDMPVYELLTQTKLAKSNREARDLIKGGGVSVNDVKIASENHRLSAADFAQGFAKLSKGKKQHIL
ncbi:MAG: tyrosine--tRNA ligase, partial [Alphaproteobacteria bacterium]